MESYQVIVLAAGQGKRMKANQNKQFIEIGSKPVLAHTLSVFEEDDWCKQIILVIHPNDQATIQSVIDDYHISKVTKCVHGGKERQDSVRHGLEALEDSMITMIHDGARPFVTIEELHGLYQATERAGAAFLAVPVTDTIKQVTDGKVKTLPRDELFAAQTPQAFRLDLIRQAHQEAYEKGIQATDDVQLVELLDEPIERVEGSYRNMKLTTPEDIQKAENMLQLNRQSIQKEELSLIRIGQGFDVHQFATDRPCIIGGVEIPYEKGLTGHSDADVLLHTVADAALGAIGEGDIGKHFPDTDPAYKDADSKKLLQHVWALVEKQGYSLGNLDCTVIAQVPKMAPYIEQIREVIAGLLKADISQINVKATTTEKLSFIGREEGIAAQAVILLQQK